MQVLRYTFNKVAKWINMQKFKFACQKSFYFTTSMTVIFFLLGILKKWYKLVKWKWQAYNMISYLLDDTPAFGNLKSGCIW